ncbi:MAG TPA: antibiotic biosynthesis monooxygenase [Vicinamibacterales bacterium]|nr:antibiotic biosynthesis monooxygenase [Vicinamibacterales bacterium]
MMRLIVLALVTLVSSSPALAQRGAAAAPPPAADAAFYSVGYVEVAPASRPAAIAALGRYRDSCPRQDGCSRIELFEQVGRAGHFALFETWRDQPSFDRRGPEAARALGDALEPIRVSALDQRPYKTLTVAAASASPPNDAVVVITHVDTSPGPQVPVLLTRLAEASRKEAGSLRFDVVQHTMRANHHTVIEVWRNQAALDAHAAAAHTKQYRDELQPLTGSPLDERVFAAVR